MTTDLTFFTNEPGASLLDRFKKTLPHVKYDCLPLRTNGGRASNDAGQGGTMIDGFELSDHAHFQMQERTIQLSWLAETLSAPDRVFPLADPHGNTHYLKQILEFGNRWLRVIVYITVDSQRVVTIFFDRRVK